jgi:hypothetical protein
MLRAANNQGVESMNRLFIVGVFALLVTGCATTSQIKEATDPLNQRLTTLEQQNADSQAKLDTINKKLDQQAVNLQGAQKQMADPTAAAQKAKQAAADAQAAAQRAETAADKAAKAFELKQKKGAK